MEISVHGFLGKLRPWVEATDFEIFTVQLRTMYESLKGEAEFSPLDKQFTMKFACGTGGRIQVTGIAWSQATYENKLEYVLEIDQSFLVSPLRELERLLSAAKQSDA